MFECYISKYYNIKEGERFLFGENTIRSSGATAKMISQSGNQSSSNSGQTPHRFQDRQANGFQPSAQKFSGDSGVGLLMGSNRLSTLSQKDEPRVSEFSRRSNITLGAAAQGLGNHENVNYQIQALNTKNSTIKKKRSLLGSPLARRFPNSQLKQNEVSTIHDYGSEKRKQPTAQAAQSSQLKSLADILTKRLDRYEMNKNQGNNINLTTEQAQVPRQQHNRFNSMVVPPIKNFTDNSLRTHNNFLSLLPETKTLVQKRIDTQNFAYGFSDKQPISRNFTLEARRQEHPKGLDLLRDVSSSRPRIQTQTSNLNQILDSSHIRDTSSSVTKKLTFVESKSLNMTSPDINSRGNSVNRLNLVKDNSRLGSEQRVIARDMSASKSPENLLLQRRRFVSPEINSTLQAQDPGMTEF